MKFTLRIESLSDIARTMAQKPRSKRNKCGCDCDGCNAAGFGIHCLTPPCTLTRNRRSTAVSHTQPRSAKPRVKVPAKRKPVVRRKPKPEPEPVDIKVDPFRSEWFVDAQRGRTDVSLPAPEGEPEARNMVDLLTGHGWQAIAKVYSVSRDDPRFHQLVRETTNAGK